MDVYRSFYLIKRQYIHINVNGAGQRYSFKCSTVGDYLIYVLHNLSVIMTKCLGKGSCVLTNALNDY